MLKHDFYADPTVFDQLKSDAGNWICERFGKLCPYSWTISFCVLGLVFLAVAVAVLVSLLQLSPAADTPSVLNQSLAQVVTMMIALLAARVVFRQALDAWPRQAEMPARLHFLAACTGFDTPAPARKNVSARPSRPARTRPDAPLSEQRATQEFFAGVRAAGVNVAIAKSLFAAGLRSAGHLRAVGDRQLRRINGVGPITVRKLRTYFGAHQRHSLPGSSSSR